MHAQFRQRLDHGQKVRKAAPQAIQPPNDQGVALAETVQHRSEFGPLATCTAHRLSEDPLYTRCLQGVLL